MSSASGGDSGGVKGVPDSCAIAVARLTTSTDGGALRWSMNVHVAHDVTTIDRPADSLVYRWVIEGRWKLLLTYDGTVSARYASSNPRDEKRPQLFDLLADPQRAFDRAVFDAHRRHTVPGQRWCQVPPDAAQGVCRAPTAHHP